MEFETEETVPTSNTLNGEKTDSTENFQKFIYDLFEKNGIINDLRAYLRGHIVNVLKSANTGESLPCQKHFTQRLEISNQAMNTLIAEYFLKMEFNYTLSVFVSEIPLANMVFDFTKTLLRNESENLCFRENDVWSILNCLGIKCDSEYACKIMEMYQKQQLPLLMCMMKMPHVYNKEFAFASNENTSEENVTTDKSTDTVDENKRNRSKKLHKCKHYSFCKTCQNRMLRLKEKCERRKTRFVQNLKKQSINSLDISCLMKNLSIVEQGIINEMFEQLKSVYETEVAMIQEEQEKSIKKTIASHSLQLQKQQEELEQSYKERETELYRNIDEKKKFLWNLAKSLRQQHEHMTKAMDDVKSENERLSAKELNLKVQIQEAEELLRKRGEDMHKQISDELTMIEKHIETMRKERDSINLEREQLEYLKKNINKNNIESNTKREVELLKNELKVLRQSIESANTKCLVEQGTSMDNLVNNLLNNDQVNRVKVNNDLKEKNVNFNMSNDNLYSDQRPSHSSLSSNNRGRSDHSFRDHSDRDHDDSDHEQSSDCTRTSKCEMRRLRNENQRLNILARQQSEHIASLASERSRLYSDVHTRPQTAPTLLQPFTVTRLNEAPNKPYVSSIGGGEQLTLFQERPRVLLPTDTLPFIGVLRDRHTDNRRHFINQWRSVRRRTLPMPQVATTSRLVFKDKRLADAEHENVKSYKSEENNSHNIPTCSCIICSEPKKPPSIHIRDTNKREKSPKSLLREAKEKLRNSNNHNLKETAPIPREKSPNTTLREAKLRLRKLEIEAEAVEKSYQDFRRRQRDEKLSQGLLLESQNEEKELEAKSKYLQNQDYCSINENQFKDQIQNKVNFDFDKYLKEYQTKFNISSFKNKNAMSELIKPIPAAFSEVEDKNMNRVSVNYLETPLSEFRKLYHTKKERNKIIKLRSPMEIVGEDSQKEKVLKEETNNQMVSDRNAELQILEDNINKIYNLSPNKIVPEIITSECDKDDNVNDSSKCGDDLVISKDLENLPEPNLLRVDIEQNYETNSIKMDSEKDVLVVVESSINTKEVSNAEIHEKDEIPTQMTIIVSPKEKSDEKSESKSSKLEILTENDKLDAIYHSKANKEESTVDMHLELSKVDSNDGEAQEDYPDDFSADVDNYNSRSEYEQHSPISFAKDSEDNFWDS